MAPAATANKTVNSTYETFIDLSMTYRTLAYKRITIVTLLTLRQVDSIRARYSPEQNERTYARSACSN